MRPLSSPVSFPALPSGHDLSQESRPDETVAAGEF
jgi:hypothetical protein